MGVEGVWPGSAARDTMPALPESAVTPNHIPIRPAHLHPRYWPLWLGLGALRLAVLLPWPAQLLLGRGVGLLAWALAPARRRVADANVAACYPQMGRGARRRLVRNHFRSVGISLFEAGMAWWGSDRRVRPLLARIEGREHLEAALATGRGVFLLGGHYTTLEIAGRLLAFDHPVQVTYKPARNPAFDAFMLRARRRSFAQVIDSRNMRAVIQGLRRGGIVWYAPDQDFGRRNAVFVPFMGVPAATLTVTARIADRSGAVCLALWHWRTPGGRYVLRFSPPVDGWPSGDQEHDARTYNALVEVLAHEHPEQYLWIHRRFKTRPPGAPRFY